MAQFKALQQCFHEMIANTLAPVALSNHGPHLSPIVAGAWRMGEWGMNVEQRVRWIEQCLDLGITSFDHADIYGGYTVETLFGEALAAQPSLRSRMQLVTKCGIKLVSPQRPAHAIKHYDTSAAHVVASVEQSLQALRTDHLDVLLIHRPDALMDAMRASDCIALELADAERVALLLEDYDFFVQDPDLFIHRLQALTELRGGDVVKAWEAQVRAGDLAAVVLDLLVRHYDPMYAQSIERNFKQYGNALPCALKDRSPAALSDRARSLLNENSSSATA